MPAAPIIPWDDKETALYNIVRVNAMRPLSDVDPAVKVSVGEKAEGLKQGEV